MNLMGIGDWRGVKIVKDGIIFFISSHSIEYSLINYNPLPFLPKISNSSKYQNKVSTGFPMMHSDSIFGPY